MTWGIAEKPEGLGDQLIPSTEREIDLGNPTRSRGPTIPRFLRSNLLDDFFLRIRTAANHLAPLKVTVTVDFLFGL